MASPSTRLDEDLYEDATVTGPLSSRSAAQQLSYWARIGRAISRAATEEQLLELLSKPYDELSGAQQATVRAEWAEAIARQASQNYAARFTAEGRSYSGLDANGNIVRHRPTAPEGVKRLFPEVIAAYFVAAYGPEAVAAPPVRPLSRVRYDQWRRHNPAAPSSAAITSHFKKTWTTLPWKKLRELAAKQRVG